MLLAKHVIAVAKEAHIIQDIYGHEQEPLKKHALLVKHEKEKQFQKGKQFQEKFHDKDNEKLLLLAEAATISSTKREATISRKSRKRKTFALLEGRDEDEFFGIDWNGRNMKCPVKDYKRHINDQTRYVIEDVKYVAYIMKQRKEPECWVTYCGFPYPEIQPFTKELQYIKKQLKQ